MADKRNTARELSEAMQAPRGQDPMQYGVSNSYLPSPPAQLFGQGIEALGDPRLGMAFPGIGMVKATRLGQTAHKLTDPYYSVLFPKTGQRISVYTEEEAKQLAALAPDAVVEHMLDISPSLPKLPGPTP
jgi:hypothetical protein